ncbi:WD40/YVTN/BNR-like repeat-containing protein, partial [Polaribacter sp.]|uniref:WD40/YVTN/BNR-like repeat-containing protein n=1 Tax=Polaribacter sp. TaxID=1920175 RepID=UPI003F69C85C
ESGGLTMDATGAENHCTILVIEPTPLEKDVLWAATDDGQIHITKDGGANWTNVAKNIKGLPENSWITQIKASNKNKGEALLVANDYRRFNYTPYAYRTKNYGKTWERIVDENDVQSYTLCIVEDPENKNLLFLGTDDGLYISLNAGDTWTKWTNGFPTVPVKDLVIHPREQDLIIGTFGRAAWVLDDIRPLRAIANGDLSSKKAVLFTPPTAYQAAYQQPTGSRFGADAMYQGENRKGGAILSYYVKIDDKMTNESNSKKTEETPKVKKDSITLDVFNGLTKIRTLKFKAPKETGVHKTTWYLREKGVSRASRRIRKSTREPAGVTVKPGVYKLKMNYGGETSEQDIIVAYDPRLKISDEAINQKYNTSKELEQYQAKIAAIVKQLVESKNTASKIQSDVSKADKKKYKEAIDASKDVIKRIEGLIALYLGKIDKRQGITRNPEITVNQRFGIASSYVRSRFGEQTATEKQLIEQFKTTFKAAVSETNTFFNNDWKMYKEKVKDIQISHFKEIKIYNAN